MKAALSGRDDQFAVVFTRTIGEKDYVGRAEMGVRWSDLSGSPAFGLSSDLTPVVDSTELLNTEMIVDIPFEEGDVITAIDGRKVESYRDIEAATKTLTGQPVTVQVNRGGKTLSFERQPVLSGPLSAHYLKDGTRRSGKILAYPRDDDAPPIMDKNWAEIDVPKDTIALEDKSGKIHLVPGSDFAGGGYWSLLDVLGMAPRLQVSGVSVNSPAAEAGLKTGRHYPVLRGSSESDVPAVPGYQPGDRQEENPHHHSSWNREEAAGDYSEREERQDRCWRDAIPGYSASCGGVGA